MGTLDEHYDAILAALPADADRADAERVLTYCGRSIAGGMDWPSKADIIELQAVASGFGCWMDDIGAAIEQADLEDAAAAAWAAAWNGCKAMLLQLHVMQRAA